MLRSLISSVGLAAVSGQVTAAVRRTSRRAALLAAAALVWLVALAFGVAAFTVWLTGYVGVVGALGIVAGIFALIGIAIAIAIALSSKQKPRPSSFQEQLSGLASPAAGGAGGTPGSLLGSLAVVAVLGWIFGRQARK